MKTLKEKIEVMQAFLDGKAIERGSISSSAWCPTDDPQWNWTAFDYRISPAKAEDEFLTLEELPNIFYVRNNASTETIQIVTIFQDGKFGTSRTPLNICEIRDWHNCGWDWSENRNGPFKSFLK